MDLGSRLEAAIKRSIDRHTNVQVFNRLEPAHHEVLKDGETHIAVEGADPTPVMASINAQFASRRDIGRTTVPPQSPPKQFTAGQLSEHFSFWNSLDLTPFVRSVIKDGLRIELEETFELPISCYKPRNSCLENSEFVDLEIKKLLTTGAITLCKTEPRLCSPLHVAITSANKKRLIIDLTELNKGVQSKI